jgi:TonB family protein
MLNHAAAVTAAALLAILPLTATRASASEIDVTRPASCDVPNVPATTLDGVPPETPVIAANLHLTGTTVVEVNLDAHGTVVGATVAVPSGSPILDRAALAAAEASSFRPERRDCLPVAGSYLFDVVFPE